jgi:hypothetical protein
MATVNMADDGASSSSQKLTYRATTAAIQIRIAKAQEARGKPHGRKAPRSMTVKTSTHASWAANEIAALRINPAVPSWSTDAGKLSPVSTGHGKIAKRSGFKTIPPSKDFGRSCPNTLRDGAGFRFSRAQDCFSRRAEILVAIDLPDRSFFLMPVPAAVEK